MVQRRSFSKEEVMDIRTRYAQGKESAKALAERYDMSMSYIYQIISGKTYKEYPLVEKDKTKHRYNRKHTFIDLEKRNYFYTLVKLGVYELDHQFNVIDTRTGGIFRGTTIARRDPTGSGSYLMIERKIVVYLIAKGKPKDDEIIASIDGDNNNCDPDNLVAMTQSAIVQIAKPSSPESIRRGNDHHFSQFTDDLVKRLRDAVRKKELTIMDIAEEYGITYTAVRSMIIGKTYQHVPGAIQLKSKK